MAITFCNTPLNEPGWHRVKTERGHYLMSPYWIDTACPRDMMDYDFTQSICEGIAASNETYVMWCRGQVSR